MLRPSGHWNQVMLVREDWDRPRPGVDGAGCSYYPPLHLPAFAERDPDLTCIGTSSFPSDGHLGNSYGGFDKGGGLADESCHSSALKLNGSSHSALTVSAALNGNAAAQRESGVGASVHMNGYGPLIDSCRGSLGESSALEEAFTSASSIKRGELDSSWASNLPASGTRFVAEQGMSPQQVFGTTGCTQEAPLSHCRGEPVDATPDAEVDVRGTGDLPGPWCSWVDVAFPNEVRSPLIAAGFPAPTLIQQHTWPILLCGRDVIGVAKTGSGKTLAFLLPAFSMLLEKRVDLRGPPSILVLAPTRELACQIEQQAKDFGAAAGMRATCLYGGAPKGPQLAELRQRPQTLVATPGRLHDFLDPQPGLSVAVDVKSVRYLVLDEADRMLDMGFEPQVRKIVSLLPQERQTVMFTATWPFAVRRLASEFLRDAAEVRIGDAESLVVNPDVEQRIVFCGDMREKEDRVENILRETGTDQAIIFVNTKRMCETVALRIRDSVCIHGDKDQKERDLALGWFKAGTRRVLVATDVAARGLDVKDVKLVLNFDPPNKEEDYVHRVGRTGRAGKKGTAITLLTNDDGIAARSIEKILQTAGLPVPEELKRRLASGEMRMSGGNGRAPSRPRRPDGGRRGFMGDDFGLRDDFGTDAGRFGSGGRAGDFAFSVNDCPTW
mmetsp:Transcript_64700/g.140965  ORF Transcript_64700/g.140965 Transcript_64700/m.140965 type:complete len:667 (+) Transcript_64700:118-2118(+)